MFTIVCEWFYRSGNLTNILVFLANIFYLIRKTYTRIAKSVIGPNAEDFCLYKQHEMTIQAQNLICVSTV